MKNATRTAANVARNTHLSSARYRAVLPAFGALLLTGGYLSALGQTVKHAAPPARPAQASADQPDTMAMNSPIPAAAVDPVHSHALMLADSFVASKELDDPIEGAMMRADFAGLVCKSGRQSEAIDVMRESARTLALRLSGLKANSREYESLLGALSGLESRATECDSNAGKTIVSDVSRLLVRKGKPGPGGTNGGQDPGQVSGLSNLDESPPVVPDSIWGTAPSNDREIPATLLCHEAYNSINSNRVDEGEALLKQSLTYCAVTGYVTATSLLRRSRPQDMTGLYVAAAQRVAAQPSGQELHVLAFGLAVADGAQRNAELGSYLDALISLLQSPYSVQSSPQLLGIIRDALPEIQTLRVSFLPQAQAWIAKSTAGLTPAAQAETAGSEFSVQQIQQIAETADDPAVRDQAFASLASSSLESGHLDRASDFASRISDRQLRAEISDDDAYVRINRLLYKSAQPGTTGGADILAIQSQIEKVSSLPMRIKLYTKLGQTAAALDDKTDATLLLEEAARLTKKQEPCPRQAHLLLGIASSFAAFDQIRAAEVLGDAVRSINQVPVQPVSRWGLLPPDTFTVSFDPSGEFPRLMIENPDQYKRAYNLSVFGKIAHSDFEGALLIAQGIQQKSLRTSAEYEVCAGILLQGSKPARQTGMPPPM